MTKKKTYTYYHGTNIGAAKTILKERKMHGTMTTSRREAMQYVRANAMPITGKGALLIIKTNLSPSFLGYRVYGGKSYNRPPIIFQKGDRLSIKTYKISLSEMASARGMIGTKKAEWINHFEILRKNKK